MIFRCTANMLVRWRIDEWNILLSVAQETSKMPERTATMLLTVMTDNTTAYKSDSHSTGRQTLGHTQAPGLKWAGSDGCRQLSIPGLFYWRWAALFLAPAAPCNWAGSGLSLEVWTWFLWELCRSHHTEWQPCNLDQSLNRILIFTLRWRNALNDSHRLKHLYSGRSDRGSSAGMLSLRVSERSGSVRIASSHGEW